MKSLQQMLQAFIFCDIFAYQMVRLWQGYTVLAE